MIDETQARLGRINAGLAELDAAEFQSLSAEAPVPEPAS